jgi:hypothetical protein
MNAFSHQIGAEANANLLRQDLEPIRPREDGGGTKFFTYPNLLD